MKAFAAAAEAFCSWAEGPPRSETPEALTARRHLARLYACALELPQSGVASDADVPDAATRNAIYRRFAALPINYYSEVDPLIVPSSDNLTGDVADDLADIWSDLKVGLMLHQAGNEKEAGHEWRWRFDVHWGQHAVSALHALHSWLAVHEHDHSSEGS
jgi:hypothetical protein